MNFIDRCLYGLTDCEEIDDYVDYWHSHDTQNTLSEFLGMRPEEYEEWAKYGDAVLREILRCRADGKPFRPHEETKEKERIAVRTYSVAELHRTGRDRG